MRQGPGGRKISGFSRRALQVAGAVVIVTVAGAGQSFAADRGSPGSSRARYLMGTRLTIECRGEVAPRVFEEAFAEVARLEGILSNWIASSELSRLNRAAPGAPFPVSDELMNAVEVSLTWAERTGGAFDPTVESLVRLYGLRGGAPAADMRAGSLGDGNGMAAEDPSSLPRPEVGWLHVVIDSKEQSVQFDREGIGIDLGGIGKGIALDEAAKILTDRGVTGGLLDFGGQVIAVGEAVPEDGWLIGVADPAQRDRAVATVSLRTGSLATSGNSERAVIGEQGTVGHLLDPRSGAPARFTGSVSVLAEDGTTADALSTALFVMGMEKGLQWAESLGIAALYVWRTAGGELEIRSTRTMRRGIDWAPIEWEEDTGT